MYPFVVRAYSISTYSSPLTHVALPPYSPKASEKSGASGDLPFHMTPSFASGNVFTSSMLDTLVCQSYYNENVINVLRLLVEGGGDFDDEWLSKVRRERLGD